MYSILVYAWCCSRLATDINESRLVVAGLMGADVLINGGKECLRDRGLYLYRHVHLGSSREISGIC